MKTIGERIRQAREAKGWSGEKLAKAVGYKKQSAISNLENRATGNGGNKLAVIADKLCVPVEWLIQGPDSDNTPFLPGKLQVIIPAVQTTVAREPTYDQISIAVALDVLGNALVGMPTSEHDLLINRFQSLVRAPDSKLLRSDIVEQLLQKYSPRYANDTGN